MYSTSTVSVLHKESVVVNELLAEEQSVEFKSILSTTPIYSY